MSKTSPYAKKFNGIYKKDDELSLSWTQLASSKNIVITNKGHIAARNGYHQKISDNISSIYATDNEKRIACVKNGMLCIGRKAHRSVEFTELLEVGEGKMFFTEANDDILFNNGSVYGYIGKSNEVQLLSVRPPEAPLIKKIPGDLPAGTYKVACTYVLKDGRETAAGAIETVELNGTECIHMSYFDAKEGVSLMVYISPSNSNVFQLAFDNPSGSAIWNSPNAMLGYELSKTNKYPIPMGCTIIQHHMGKIYAAYYDSEKDISTIWISDPFDYHLFDYVVSNISIPGNVLCLASIAGKLLIGTDEEIYSYNDDALLREADFGVAPGKNAIKETIANNEERVLIWTKRGLCSAFPVRMLTDEKFDAEVANNVSGAIIERDGNKHYIASIFKK